MTEGYAGHRFVVAAANQPPFVFRRIKSDLDGGNPRVVWDGVEIRLLKLLAERNNFSVEIIEPREPNLGPADSVAKEIMMERADIGIAGMYLTNEKMRDMDVSIAHSTDCAIFITLMSTALPRSKRSVLHISNECFVPFGVAISFPNNSVYSAKMNFDISRMIQSGLIDKITNEVRFEMQRSLTGHFLAAGSGTIKIPSAEEKGLTLEDTQGMFLLLAAGFIIAGTALVSEWMGGFTRRCRFTRKVDTPTSVHSGDQLIPTPKTDVDSEIRIIGDTESRLNFDSRPSTAVSTNTLDGQIINVTEENFDVHNSFNVDRFDSRRSSSLDLDREVREIFEKDSKRRRFVSHDMESLDENGSTVSRAVFGDPIKYDK
ncbi:hypothetical protein PYW08_007224 [Mythimna loreyi]|uniref:Uncharacterized protein n=1 Tax=Mythimna loreyi TaxID=667449 RepID=A0ACC2RAF0_9NEOP|nr:hypothetical protein PYW08_007224 [Mythimna loreyi]